MSLLRGYQKHCSSKCSSKTAAEKQWSGDKGNERRRTLRDKMIGNHFSVGRPPGSKNKNPYPITDAVRNRSRGNTYWLGKKHSLETLEKMSESRVKWIKENGGNMAYKGKYRPENPQKYKGDPRNIVFRSLWERKMMKFYDLHSSVIEWSSEEVIIIYRDPVRGHNRRYFVDFFCKIKQTNGSIGQFLVEIKPYAQIKEPTPRKKTQKYVKEVSTYITNISKWRAAKLFCEKAGWEFLVLSEYEIGIKPAPKNGYKQPSALLENVL